MRSSLFDLRLRSRTVYGLFVMLCIMASITSIGCPTAIEPGIEPPTPVFVQHASPPAPDDAGIYADVGSSPNTIVLQWHPDTVSQRTTGYRVFRSPDAATDGSGMLLHGALLSSFESSFPYPVDTFYRDTLGIVPGPRYYYQVQAFNRSATNRTTYGPPTKVVDSTSFQVMSVLSANNPTGQVSLGSAPLSLIFTIPTATFQGGNFQFVVRRPSGEIMWSSGDSSIFGIALSETYPSDTTIAKRLIEGETYQWRVKQLAPFAGSSSIWQSFSVHYK